MNMWCSFHLAESLKYSFHVETANYSVYAQRKSEIYLPRNLYIYIYIYFSYYKNKANKIILKANKHKGCKTPSTDVLC